jgi:hypothetical protein
MGEISAYKIWLESVNERDNFVDLGLEGRMMLKMNHKEMGSESFE